MTDDVVIRVDGLSKSYQISHQAQEGQHTYRRLSEDLVSWASWPWQKVKGLFNHQEISKPTVEEFWALKNVSFEVKRGEVIGIIGRNGSGKSTLLKILSRITEPTEGRVEIGGRVASLLEVGTGFHPELTGRENIYLNGAILGMSRAEIRKKFDEIVDFAEIEKFLDTPVKRYSSGMYVRLAFAVAAYLEPEILLVDEVLAVGDAAFQKKCLGKMGDVVEEGRTVLFVSHNVGAIRSLCQNTILIEHGKIALFGLTEMAADKYLKDHSDEMKLSVDTRNYHRPENILPDYLRINKVTINSKNKQAIVFSQERFELLIYFDVFKPLNDIVFGLSIYTLDKIRVFQCRSIDSSGLIGHMEPGSYEVSVIIESNPLNPGYFSLGVGARCSDKSLENLPDILNFQVEYAKPLKSLWLEERSGIMTIESTWTKPKKVNLKIK